MLDQITVSRMKQTLRESIDNNEISGANMMIIKDGQEVFYHEDGLADREAWTPISRDSIFRLYSFSKPITAASVMILVERGVIDIYDPVSRFLPGFKNQKVAQNGELVPAVREVTIHDLLSMTSGLVYGGEDLAGKATGELFQEIERGLYSDAPINTLDAMNRLGTFPLFFQPGASWQYGSSADVLGAVVEVASGMGFGDFLQKEMFSPLGMTDTGFWVPDAKRSRLTKTYENTPDGGMQPYTGNNLGILQKMDREPAFESGGAGLVSTIDDAARFTTMLMNGGTLDGAQILKPRTVRYLTSSTLSASQQQAFEAWNSLSGHSYGNLMRVMTDTSRSGILGSLGEYGWDGWLGAYFCNCPSDGLTILFMTQKRDAGTLPITRKLRNIVFSNL
ncbi:serine hydrolase domain-containing protein [Gorillibacterium massiliense]|uniref:serine hydrolase domain-containing protein n=1 Tax=Gorillibacterium massiliense TaxID=1280390 RepID=UPI0004BA33A4|nr:serine hydrolase domain-containing protein [Gorillibacterium massiliense]